MPSTTSPFPTGLSRRQFLRASAVVGASIAIVPARVLGRGAEQPPNRKLNIAGIGIGGQGGHDVNEMASENIVALCDVDAAHASGMFKKYPKAKRFKDYRKMLDELPELDAVVIGTPDHHHAPAAMEAIRRKKHVYCEKPLTHSVWEARRVAQAAREAKVATQMGNQGQASEETRRLCEYVWAGAIGDITEVHVWTDRPSNGLFNEYWPQGVPRPKENPAPPATLDWDLWIGPAPMRPYNSIYAPFRWRGWWDFGTGALGDIGCHALDPVFRALKLGAPLSVQGSSTRVNKETFPLGSIVTWQFPARTADLQLHNPHLRGQTGRAAGGVALPALKLVWSDGGLRPPRFEGLPDGQMMGDNGRLLIGTKGMILGNRIYPEARAKEVGEIPKTLPRSPGHYQEFIAACKGGLPAGSHFDFAGPLAEAVLLGNVPLHVELRDDLTRYRLLWDAAAFRFTNLDDANTFLKREYRAGWSV
jgi:predicted dehydrogenase